MINANEQRVIDVASGTFEYQNELYTVRSTYLSSLKSEFNKENVEITEEQANSAIQKMFGNIDQGIKDGYLKKLTDDQKEKAIEQGEVQALDEIGVTGDGEKEKPSDAPEQHVEEQQEQSVVVAKNGKSYPIQKKPVKMQELETVRTMELEATHTFTSNEQIASQLHGQECRVANTLLISWVACIIVLTVFLKVFKHRKKAFLSMFGASLMGIAILAVGIVYMYSTRACSEDAWQTVALESGYFKECTQMAHDDLQKVFTTLDLEADVSILALEDNVIYRDTKSIFAARFSGKELPKLEKRQEKMREALRLILPKEPVQNVNRITEVLIDRYRQILDTPYVSFLYELRQAERQRNLWIFAGALVLFVLAILFIWRGGKYVHRKVRGLSYGIGIAGASFMIAAIVDMFKKKAISVEPKSYRLLFEHYMSWCDENILYFGILILFLSIFTWTTSYVMKKNYMEKHGLK